MRSLSPIPTPRQNPALIDRLRASLRVIDKDLESNPNHLAAHEFRRFLVRAIDEIESKQLNAAA